MKKLLLIFLIFPITTFADTLAVCEKPTGHSFFPFSGLNPKDMSGWDKDGISNGIVQLEHDGEKFDIQFVDASKQIVSATDDGADVFPFAFTENSIGITTIYMGRAIENYMFAKENNGNLIFTMTATKVNAMLQKASVMQGKCSFIDIEKLNKILSN